VAFLSMIVGVLLIGIGIGAYVYTDQKSITALIPAFLGVILIILGVLARNDRMRKHSMHAAMLFALLGVIVSLWRLTKSNPNYPAIPYFHIAVVVCCALFIALGIKSFIDARRRRQQ